MITGKVVMIGNTSVGKSCILNYLKFGKFCNNMESTIGCEFQAKSFNLYEKEVKLLIWDTAGQEVFKAFTPQFLRNANIIVIVYDLSDDNTFKDIETWLKISESEPNAPVIICGNKSDLNKNIRAFDIICNDIKIKYPDRKIYYFKDISAKTGENIEKLFEYVAYNLLKCIEYTKNTQNTQNTQNENNIVIHNTTINGNNFKNGCC